MQRNKNIIPVATVAFMLLVSWLAFYSGDKKPVPEPAKTADRESRQTIYHPPALTADDYQELNEVYHESVKSGIADENTFSTEEKLQILQASALYGKKTEPDQSYAHLKFSPSAAALRDRQQYAREWVENQRTKRKFLLGETEKQYVTMSRTIKEAKENKTRTPEEIQEAEEALAKLKEAEEALAALEDKTPDGEIDNPDTGDLEINLPIPTEE